MTPRAAKLRLGQVRSTMVVAFALLALALPRVANAHDVVFRELEKRGSTAEIQQWVEYLIVGRAHAADAKFKGPAKPKGISAKDLAKFDLGKELPGMNRRDVRARFWTIKPDGIVPVHSHKDRPALIYVLAGEVIEHRSDDDKPVVYKRGDLSVEAESVLHWWENKGKETVYLLAIDVFNTKS